jgi:DNA-binding NarL/FixJ family response regulator
MSTDNSRVTPAQPIRVLLVDDEPMFLEAVRALLEPDERVRVVASTDDGEKALELAGVERPDVALVDLAMPGMNGYEIMRRMIAASPALLVLAVSGLTQPSAQAEATDAGACGFLLKGALHGEIAEAIVAAVDHSQLH